MTPAVAVTGIGVVSGLGVEIEAHRQALRSGRSALRPADEPCLRNDAGLPIAGVRNFKPRREISNRTLRKLLPPGSQYSVSAARQALQDAGLYDDAERRATCGLFFGSPSFDLGAEIYRGALQAAMPSEGTFDFARFGRVGLGLVDPLVIVKGLPNAGISGTAMEHKLRGPNLNLADGPVGGLAAVAAGAAAIRRGDVDFVVAGAYDSSVSALHQLGKCISPSLTAEGVEPAVACRPFALDRDGFLFGEGAAMVVLESVAHARARGARIKAQLGSWGTSPGWGEALGGDALRRAVRQALNAQGSAVPEVIFGDGIGTIEDDLREAQVLHSLFPEPPDFTCAAAAIGNTGAARAVFSLVHAVDAIDQRYVPPTMDAGELDPACTLPLVTQLSERGPSSVLVWCSDEGHKNAALLLSREA